MKMPYYEPRTQALAGYFSDVLDFDAHIHREIELVYIISGTSKVNVDGNIYNLKKNDIFIAFPNQIHTFFDSKDVYYCIYIVSPDLIPDWASVLMRFKPVLNVLPLKNFDDEIIEDLLKILLKKSDNEHTDKQSDKVFLYTLRAFFEILMKKIPIVKVNRTDADLIEKIYGFIHENYCEPLSVSVIAKKFNISKSYAAHIFSDRLKIGFCNFVNTMRINKACELLGKDNLNITEIANECGFSTIRTFNRVFLKTVGMTPKAYRNSGNKTVDILKK